MAGINRLTDRDVKNAKPIAKRQKIADGGSLFLFVEPQGSKLWRMPYSFAGKQKILAFGVYPTISLALARTLRDEAKVLLAQNIDPGVEKQKRKKAAAITANSEPAAKTGLLFRDVARSWYDKQQSAWSHQHKSEVWKSFDTEVFPLIGDRELGTIQTNEILTTIVEPLERQGKIEKAQRVVQRMRAVFAYAKAAGIMATDNPCADLRGAMKPKPRVKPRPSIIDIGDLRAMLKAMEATPCHVTTRLANRFIALTAMRPGNVNTAEWAEIEADCWVIPATKMKAGRPFMVPLSRQALEIVEALRPFSAGGRYMFPNGRSAMSPMSENALTYYLNRAGYQNMHCAHGWRSSFSSIMNLRHASERHVIDFALAHLPKDRVEAAYNRAEYLDRRREHLQEWADLLLEGQLPVSALTNLRSR